MVLEFQIIVGLTGKGTGMAIWTLRFFRACTVPITGDGDGGLVRASGGMPLVGAGVPDGIIFRFGTIHGTTLGVLPGAGEVGTIGITGLAGVVGDTVVGDTVVGVIVDGVGVDGTMLAGAVGAAGAETLMFGYIEVPVPGLALVEIV